MPTSSRAGARLSHCFTRKNWPCQQTDYADYAGPADRLAMPTLPAMPTRLTMPTLPAMPTRLAASLLVLPSSANRESCGRHSLCSVANGNKLIHCAMMPPFPSAAAATGIIVSSFLNADAFMPASTAVRIPLTHLKSASSLPSGIADGIARRNLCLVNVGR